MYRELRPCLAAVVLILLSGSCLSADRVLFDFDADFDVAGVPARDAKLALLPGETGRTLQISTGHDDDWPGVTFAPGGEPWDLSGHDALAADVTNRGKNPLTIGLRVDSPRLEEKDQVWQQQFTVVAGETSTLRLPLKRRTPAELESKLFGMRGYPGGFIEGRGIDTTRVIALLVFVSRPETDHVFEIDNVRVEGSGDPAASTPADPERLFPMIDRFGQYVHKRWPGKIHAEAELAEQRRREAADLEANPGPADRNQYGGWTAGPQLEARGFFRPEKVEGRWWLVDPAGRLFWSHGTDCVRPGAYTPITDREHWFEALPEEGSSLARFYSRGGWAPHGYYQGKRYRTYDFHAANLLRKYGEAWKEEFADLAHRRLRSWGMNTVANWSDSFIYLQKRTPYVVSIHTGSKPLEGSSGYWGKFPDVFDPGFRRALGKRMSDERGRSAGDPWCIGYFIGNELSWGDELSLATAALTSPAEQAAKQAFVADLKAKYARVDKLNDAWGSDYASWDALFESRDEPDKEKAREDLAAFYTRTADTYFRTCREAVKEVAEDNLYLGCRFAWVNDRAARAAALHCDVVSYNRYQESVADFALPDGVDKPVVIGEFHFGALDRGMLHTGLRPVADQNARAEAYRSYVRGALANPVLVGTHWFQYHDQATTGRGDGENYQIGLLDVCDNPYPETIEAVRQVGAEMYTRRYEGQ